MAYLNTSKVIPMPFLGLLLSKDALFPGLLMAGGVGAGGGAGPCAQLAECVRTQDQGLQERDRWDVCPPWWTPGPILAPEVPPMTVGKPLDLSDPQPSHLEIGG